MVSILGFFKKPPHPTLESTANIFLKTTCLTLHLYMLVVPSEQSKSKTESQLYLGGLK